MKKVAVVTDSNAGIRQKEAKELGIFVLPMPFTIDDQTYYEDINLTHEEFFEKQLNGAEIFTSQPVVGNVKELWDQILKDYDEIVHIPMSSGLSGSCQTAMMLAQEYDNRVFVVDSQRISVTQKYDVIDAKRLADQGKSGQEICDILTENKLNASISPEDNKFNIFSFNGIIKSFASISLLNLIFSYALRYIMLKVFILITPFAILTLINSSTSWFFKMYVRTIISLFLLQSLVSIILIVIFTFNFETTDIFSQLMYIRWNICIN